MPKATIIIFLLFFSLLSTAQENMQQDNGQGSLRIIGQDHSGQELPDYVVVKDISLEHNYTTRKRIILREMMFAVGDTIEGHRFMELAQNSRQNLLNTALFNFVELLVDLEEKPYARVYLSFVERWYFWPLPILELGERNINTWLSNPRIAGLNYGINLMRSNFRGRGETLGAVLRFGYRQNYSLVYHKPYINRLQTLGFTLEGGARLNRELAYTSLNNRQLFYSEPSGFVYRHYFLNTSLVYRPEIHNSHTLSLGVNRHEFADTLLLLNPEFSPGNQAVLPFFTLSYYYKSDHRDIRAYPLEGYYFDLRLTRKGLGILPNENMDLTSLEISARKFWKLSNSWYTAAGVNAKWSEGNSISYFYQQGLGFKGDLVRGFENYVINGQGFFVLKSNLKYALLQPRMVHVPFIDNPRFSLIHYGLYLNFYADAGRVKDKLFYQTNSLGNQWLAGTGLGLDLVTYYDKVFRIEWSLNSLWQSGIFFHLRAPI